MKDKTLLLLFLVLYVTACNRGNPSGTNGVPDRENLMNEAREDSVRYRYALKLQSGIGNGIEANDETEPVRAQIDQDSADDPAIFDIGGEIYIAGSNKTGGIHLYDIDGNEIRYFDCGLINNVDVRRIVNNEGDTITILGGSNRTDNSISLIKMGENNIFSPDSAVVNIPTNLDEIYGFCMYRNNETGKTYAFVNSKGGKIQQWLIGFSESGILTAEKERVLSVASQPEGMVADDRTGRLYIGEERRGIHVFNARPEGSSMSHIIPESDSTNMNISYDIEGLSIYPVDDTRGYLVASSQGNFSYAVFDLETEKYLGSFKITDGIVDGVEETDGLDIWSGFISEEYPAGILVVQDGFNYDGTEKRPQNFKIIDWRKIQQLLD